MTTKLETNALTLLKADHALVATLFSKYEDASDVDEKLEIARDICTMLTIHALCEEELVYPPAHQVIEEDLVYEAEIEHGTAKELIADIEAGSPDDDNYDALVKVLSEYIKHHVTEEENEMFPRLAKSKLDLIAIGAAIISRKAELKQQLGVGDDDEMSDGDMEKGKPATGNVKKRPAAAPPTARQSR